MPIKLTDRLAKSMLPAERTVIHYCDQVPGFGLRVTPAGAKALVLNYRNRSGRERRYTIGPFPGISVAAARALASKLKADIHNNGADPLEELEAERGAPTVADLCRRFTDEHLQKKRRKTQTDYQSLIRLAILPAWKHRKVADIKFADVDALHRKVTERGAHKDGGRGAPYQANRMVAVLSKMFALAIRWGWRTDNPTKGLERNPETKRRRYLSADELAALLSVLAERDEAARAAGGKRDRAADITRMLLLTGARRGEVLGAQWGQFDLKAGTWTKPANLTKQKSEHDVPLSAPARQLLSEIRERLASPPDDDDAVFPGRGPNLLNTATWSAITARAGLRDFRVHDLRHSYASFLASAGLSLPTIGALLGHSQPATTARYAHLFDDPLRQATERVGEIVTASGKPSAAVVPLKGTM
jgi:integrase